MILPNGLIIRSMIEEDIPHIIHVWEETGMGGSARGDNREVILHTLRHGGVLFVMVYEDQLIGTSWITSDGRRLYLHHFGILPAWQGRGWSKFLLNRTLSWAKECKMQIKLEVHRNNEIATLLYKKAGFTYLGDYDVYIIRDVENLNPYEIL